MTTIRRSHPDERNDLYELWAAVFEEDRQWLDRFFAARYASDTIFLATVDGKIASALHALPSLYVQNEKTFSCSYIVGAATDPAYRRQGLMGKLLSAAAQSYDHPITLFPAVRPYYQANGYLTTSSTLTFSLPSKSNNPLRATSHDWQALDEIYQEAHKREGYLVRDQIAWQFLTSGYRTVALQDAYAFIKDGQAVEANALDSASAERLIDLLCSLSVKSIQVLSEGPLAALFEQKEGVPTPMGMSTHPSMLGVYIAEQY